MTTKVKITLVEQNVPVVVSVVDAGASMPAEQHHLSSANESVELYIHQNRFLHVGELILGAA